MRTATFFGVIKGMIFLKKWPAGVRIQLMSVYLSEAVTPTSDTAEFPESLILRAT